MDSGAPTRGSRGLGGVRVAVTRGRGGELVTGLEGVGAEVLWIPILGTAPPVDRARLDGAASRVEGYDWVVFTSVTGVEWFVRALEGVGQSAAALGSLRVAAIGPVTAGALEALGVRVEVVPEAAVAESLLDALLGVLARGGGVGGQRVLLPVAAGARRVLEDGLSAVGAIVDRVEAYRTVGIARGVESLVGSLRSGSVDVLTFASPSAVEFFVEGAGAEVEELVTGVLVAVIGPITGAAARSAGLVVGVEAEEYTSRGLVTALEAYYSELL